jgi:hypothetical protein
MKAAQNRGRFNVIDSHALERPTRFGKQLAQIVYGGVAIGLERSDAIRCARDSMPPIRLAIIEDLAKEPASSPGDVRQRLNKPWSTIKRQLEALHMLEVLDMHEIEDHNFKGETIMRPHYTLADGIDPSVLMYEFPTGILGNLSPKKLLPTPLPQKKTHRCHHCINRYIDERHPRAPLVTNPVTDPSTQ